MSFGLKLDVRLQQRLSAKQQLELRQLQELRLSLELKSPPPIDAVRGLSGIRVADTLLKKEGKVGVLIGGLAMAIWKKGSTPAELESHKDVDVLIFDAQPPEGKEFAGGVDWWCTNEHFFEYIRSVHGSQLTNVRARWHENGNGVVLRYGVSPRSYVDEQHNFPMTSGLYILAPNDLASLKALEIRALAEFKGRTVDSRVHAALERKIRREMTASFMQEARGDYAKKVLARSHFDLISIDPDYYAAIQERQKSDT